MSICFSLRHKFLELSAFSVDFKPKSLAGEKETFIAFGGNGDVQVTLLVFYYQFLLFFSHDLKVK